MSGHDPLARDERGIGDGTSVAQRLERSEVVVYPTCPFPLPGPEDQEFLFGRRLGLGRHKNISYDPNSDRLGGFPRHPRQQFERLRSLLADFSRTAVDWLSRTVPEYAASWRHDRVSYRPLEEATRKTRLTARNDLLHVDSFPTRPTHGWRLLRLFVNINPTEPRVWVTSEAFPQLLQRYGEAAGLPGSSNSHGWASRLLGWMSRLVRPGRRARSEYDSFMMRFHHYLKRCDEFQERCTRRVWSFPPGSLWLVMTDSVSHAVLRGRYALEHSFFVDPATLVLPELSPASLLAGACGRPVLPLAA